MATIKEIAKICNVSIATVSNILNDKPGASEETKKLVLKTVKELNYTPNSVARNLKMKNTRTIGVIAEDMTIFCMSDIIDGITEHCEEENYQIILMNLRLYKKFDDVYYSNDDYIGVVHEGIKGLLGKQVDGIIYVAAHEREIHCIPENLSIPVVVAYGYSQFDKIPSVIVNDVQGGYDVVSYIVQKGHKRIGVIAGKNNSIHTQKRLLGYQKALFDNHILYDPSLIFEGDWTRSSGQRYLDSLLEKEVTAVFCMNDLMAGGVYDGLAGKGMSVGDTLSVVGYDNRELSGYYKPALTTMSLPLHDIGYCASEVIINLLDGRNGDCSVNKAYYMEGKLIIRESVSENMI